MACWFDHWQETCRRGIINHPRLIGYGPCAPIATSVSSIAMTLFEWLLVGHLIGDWVFQNDWMARHKQNGFLNRAILVHCAVYTAVLLLIYFLPAASPRHISTDILFAGFVYISHWLIDATGLARRWIRLFRQTDAPFMRIAVDQILHVVVLALLVEFVL